MKLLILGLIGWLSVISCQEDPPTTVDVVTEEKDINDDNVSDADESASEDVVDPNSDGYIEGSELSPAEDGSDLESFRMKSYLQYNPYEKKSAHVSIGVGGNVQIPRKIHVLSENTSIENGQLASIRVNQTEFCYYGVVSNDPESPSHFLLESYKQYREGYQCVEPVMDLELEQTLFGPVTAFQNGQGYIAQNENVILRYSEMLELNDTARFPTEYLENHLYIGNSKFVPAEMDKADAWNFAWKIHIVDGNNFAIQRLQNTEVYNTAKKYSRKNSVVKLVVNGINRIEIRVNDYVAGQTSSNFYTGQKVDMAVLEPHDVFPILTSGTTKSNNTQIEDNSNLTIPVSAGYEFWLDSGWNSKKVGSVIKARIKSIID